jgi:biotin carboxyl carrier protein
MRYHVTVGGRTRVVDVTEQGVTLDGKAVDASLGHVAGTHLRSLLLDGSSHRVVARRAAVGVWELHVRGRRLTAEVVDERTRKVREMTGAASKNTGPRPLRAPMPGLVVKVEVAVGDDVQPGQGLVIVEAMKMENELRAESVGRVSKVRVEPGQAVDKDQILIELEAPGGEATT